MSSPQPQSTLVHYATLEPLGSQSICRKLLRGLFPISQNSQHIALLTIRGYVDGPEGGSFYYERKIAIALGSGCVAAPKK